MIAFGHTAVGTAVGLAGFSLFQDSNPVYGLVATGAAGVVSHYIADAVPHGHFFVGMKNFKKDIVPVIFLDLAVSIALYLFATYYVSGLGMKFLYVMFGIGGSQLPDVVDGLIYIGKLPKKGFLKIENDFHQWTHWHSPAKTEGLALGLRDIWQLTVVLVVLSLLLVT